MSCDFLANFEIRDEFVFYLAAQIIAIFRSFTELLSGMKAALMIALLIIIYLQF